ncbi:hypothetical protein [Lysinibacillus sp. NPDC086135]|uniref:hypothetical protein n=1 Tax=Lysinibacillus sp. NPDC086135 TaxID=3364130 RepID=UPI00380EAA2B
MAGKGIKGITFNISGDTTGLDKALSKVEKEAVKTQKELKEVEKAAKIDPHSTEMYAQKMQLLEKQVGNTKEKLDTLKQAQQQVEQQFQSGRIGEEQYRAFQRELSLTESALKSYQGQMDSTRNEHHALAESTKNMKTFFEATGTSVDTFSDVLGTTLTNAIKEGRASSQQLETALEKMGKTALGSSMDFEKMKHALSKVDQRGLKAVQKDLSKVAKEAKNAGDEVNVFGNKMSAGGGLAAMIHEALDVSTLNTNIEISMGLKGGDAEKVRSSIMDVTSAIGDEEAAYEGVRRQMTLNKDASMATNQEIIKGASMISRAYKEIDFKELIQETHEIGKELGISQKDALALTNQLLAIGFPPEQLDIISEYGNQLQRAGYDGEQIQALFAAGVETGTWNIDNLLDGLKEGRIRATEFGEGLNKAQANAVRDAGLSTKAFEDWGVAIAKGGEEGNKAFQDMTKALMSVENDTKRNTLGTEIFGTMWEDQGDNISATILNMNKHMKTTADMQGKLTDDVSKMDADPAYRLSQAMNEIKASLAPVLADLAEVVAKIADWVAENPKLTGTLVAIVGVLGTLVGAFATLMPAISSFIGLLGGAGAAVEILGGAIAVLSGPIGWAIAAIAALGVGAYALNEHMSQSAIEVTDWSESVSEGTAKAVGGFLELEKGAENSLKQMAWSGETVTKEMADGMVNTTNQMAEQILGNMKEQHAQQLEGQKTYFAESNALSAEREAEIMAQTQKQQQAEEKAVTEGQAKIKEIMTKAVNEKRGITEQEAAAIEAIQLDMRDKGIKYLSESEEDQKFILETMKNDASALTAQSAAEVVKNSKEARDKTIKDAEETYKERVKAITRMRDEDKSITKEEADAMIEEAKRGKNESISSAKEMHNKVVAEAKGQAKEHVAEVNWETGEVKSKWQMLGDDIAKIWGYIVKGATAFGKGVYDAIKKPVDDTIKFFKDGFNDVVNWFGNLKIPEIKIPKPKLPKFDLTFGSKEVFGKTISYPNGFDVSWHAKGGVFDTPTLFPTASGMHGVGEAGAEAVIPLTPKVLGGIGKGIASQMGASQQPVIYVMPQDIYMDSTLVGKATTNSVSNAQQALAQRKAMSKGVNLY